MAVCDAAETLVVVGAIPAYVGAPSALMLWL
jgi:hypothetical protein